MIKYLPYVGWPIAVALFLFWLDGRENLAKEIERCNSDKLQSIAAAERAVRERLENAHAKELADAAHRLWKEQNARHIADAARHAAEKQAAEAQALIRDLMNEDSQDETDVGKACMHIDVPADIVDRLQ